MYNEQQLSIINATEKKVLALAGAGTGKSTTLNGRVIKQLKDGVRPNNIAVITFTKDACESVELKIEKNGMDTMGLTIKTLHAFCYMIYSTYCDFNQKRRPKPITDPERAFAGHFWKLVPQFKNMPHKSLKEYMSFIQHWQLNMDTPEELIKREFDVEVEAFKRKMYGNEINSRMAFSLLFFAEYETWKRVNGCLDFMDMLTRAIRCLDQCPRTKSFYQNKFKYIHVDESQDTNALVVEVLKHLVGPETNVTFYGDFRQSIYSFMNAVPSVVMHYTDINGFKEYGLNTNYRSSVEIVENANHFIANYPDVNRGGDLQANRPKFGFPTVSIVSDDEINEYHNNIELIKNLVSSGYDYNDIAILYRTNAQAMLLLDYCVSNNIPFCIKKDSSSIFDRSEMKDIFTYLKIFNELDQTTLADFKKIANKPLRYVTNKSLESITKNENEKGFGRILFEKHHSDDKVNKFATDLYHHYKTAKKMTITEQVNYIMDVVGYADWWSKSDANEALFDLGLYTNAISNLANQHETYRDLVKHINLVRKKLKEANSENGLRFYTIHGSKGLEFPVCIVLGVCSRLYPFHRAVMENGDEGIKEEARLFYVASTRPIERLYYSEIVGKLGKFDVRPSHFVKQSKRDIIQGEEFYGKENHNY